MDVGIGYDVSIAEVQDIIGDVLRGHNAVKDDPAPLVLIDSLGSSTVNLRAYFWCDGHHYSTIKIKSALLRLMKKALIERGISMPDDAREIIFPEGIPVVEAVTPALRESTPDGEADVDTGIDRRPIAAEPGHSATEAEGGLGNVQAEVRAQAAAAEIPGGDEDLLTSRDRKTA